MLKIVHFIPPIFLLIFSFHNAESITSKDDYIVQNSNYQNFSGTWNYELHSEENELLNATFELHLIQNKNNIKGQYCAVARGGRRIDCDDATTYNISGEIKDKVAFINFTGFYDKKAKGKAKLYFVNGNLVWEILSIKGEIYAPKKAILKNDNNIETVEGLYILKSCDNSRFKIKLEKKDTGFLYSIFDKNKIISKGKASITKNQISLGKIGGEFSKNTLVIQNYGNAINEYHHFTQCDEKYLSFIRN